MTKNNDNNDERDDGKDPMMFVITTITKEVMKMTIRDVIRCGNHLQSPEEKESKRELQLAFDLDDWLSTQHVTEGTVLMALGSVLASGLAAIANTSIEKIAESMKKAKNADSN